MKAAMRKWMEKHWGKRCKEFAWGCPCCMAWASFDYLFGFEGGEERWQVVERTTTNNRALATTLAFMALAYFTINLFTQDIRTWWIVVLLLMCIVITTAVQNAADSIKEAIQK